MERKRLANPEQSGGHQFVKPACRTLRTTIEGESGLRPRKGERASPPYYTLLYIINSALPHHGKRVIMTQEEKNLLIEEHCRIGEGHPAVYCGTYRKYNDGNLDGRWIDLTTFADYDEFVEFCNLLHDDEEDPELMFQDYENFPEAWYCESLMSEVTFYKIQEFAEFDLDEDKQEAFKEFIDEVDQDGGFGDFEDRYYGHYDSPIEFAEEFVADVYGETLNNAGAGWLASYINYGDVWYCALKDDFTLTKGGYLFHD